MQAILKKLDELPVATLIVVVVGAVVGGIITITNPQTLDFNTYLKDLGILAGGSGLLGLARAHSGKGIK